MEVLENRYVAKYKWVTQNSKQILQTTLSLEVETAMDSPNVLSVLVLSYFSSVQAPLEQVTPANQLLGG